MVWYKIRNKPISRIAFKWDGTDEQLRGHFSPTERQRYNLRMVGIGKERFTMIDTLHGPSCTKPGDWIVKALWPTGIEIYSVKPQVFETAYEIVGEVEQAHDDD